MRVLQACIRYPPARGGVETHVQRLSEGLAERGHEVHVATSTLRSEFPFEHLEADELSADRAGSVEIHRFKAGTLGGDAHWPYLRGLHRWLLRNARGFDLIHAHSYGFHHTLACLAAARFSGKPFVLTPHYHPHWSMECGPRRKHLRQAFDLVAKRVLLGAPDALVAVSRAEAQLLEAPRPERVHWIPNGVEPRPFQDARGEPFRDRHKLNGKSVLYVGRLAANKGLFTLLDAWQRMPRDATLLIAGDGHLRAPLTTRAQELGLQDSVRMLGPLSDQELREGYAAADVFVLPSEYEAFGIVLLEAMAAGKPVVATRAGGMEEVVHHGKTGLLVPVGDSGALSLALQSVLDDPGQAKAMGEAGRGRLQEGYTWDAVVQRVEGLYERLLA